MSFEIHLQPPGDRPRPPPVGGYLFGGGRWVLQDLHPVAAGIVP